MLFFIVLKQNLKLTISKAEIAKFPPILIYLYERVTVKIPQNQLTMTGTLLRIMKAKIEYKDISER